MTNQDAIKWETKDFLQIDSAAFSLH